jgi:hypothetical protein
LSGLCRIQALSSRNKNVFSANTVPKKLTASAARLLQMRDFQLEHQQRDDDREHRAAECFGASEAELTARKDV